MTLQQKLKFTAISKIYWMQIKLWSFFKETINLQMWSLAIQYVNKQNVNENSNTFQILAGILSYDQIYFMYENGSTGFNVRQWWYKMRGF